VCGATHPFLLAKRGKRWLCYEHLVAARGGRLYEDHHTLPRRLDPITVVRVPANNHRLLEEMKRDWPPEVLKNPTNDSLLRLAGEALSRADIAHLEETNARGEAAWLLVLHRQLTYQIGPDYATKLHLPPLARYTDNEEDR